MIWLMLALFAASSVVTGFWGFSDPTNPGAAAAQVLFWFCLVVFGFLVFFALWAPARRRGPPA